MPLLAAPASAPARTTGSTILIAEDNRTVGRVIGKILENEGHQVEYVVDGAAALDALLNRRLDLALLAANLPGMNAVEVTNLYRFGSKGRQHVPILGLTGEVSAPTLSAWINAGLDGCVGKPIEPNELIEAVNSCLEGEEPRLQHLAKRASRSPDPAQSPAVDPRVLGDLEQLGGEAFVDDVIAQFIADASRLLPELAASAAAKDSAQFRDQLHALRSCAGNVGAVGLYKLCLASHGMSPRDLLDDSSDYVARLETAFEDAVAALDARGWRNQLPA